MNPVLKRDLKRLAIERERVAQEFHTVLSRGEEVLDHAHQVAHDIQEKVRKMLQTDGRDNAPQPPRREKGTLSKPDQANPDSR